MNEIRSHDYVNHPYAAVRDALVKDPAAVLSAATNAAAARAKDVAAALQTRLPDEREACELQGLTTSDGCRHVGNATPTAPRQERYWKPLPTTPTMRRSLQGLPRDGYRANSELAMVYDRCTLNGVYDRSQGRAHERDPKP